MINKISYENSIINLANSLLKHYNVFPSYKTLRGLDNYLKQNYNHVVLIVLDGLGSNLINKHLSSEDLLKKNTKQIINSVFPPTTVAATNAILSAKPPFRNGYVGWMQYNKFALAHEVVFLNIDYYDHNKKIEPSLNEDILKYENILQLIKKNNSSLHVELLFPSFHKTSGYENFSSQLDRLLMITKKEKSFSYCYFDEPDLTVHKHGVNSEVTKNKIQSLNALYERFLNEINDDVLVIVTADHGLIDVEPIKLYNYKDIIKTFKMKPALESRALSFYIKENEKENFEKLFNKYFKDDFLLLTKQELYESNLLGYGIKHQLLDSFIGDYIAIAITNKMFQLKEGAPFKAHHAGLTKEELEVPLIINKWNGGINNGNS